MDYLKKNGFSKSCPATKTKTTHKICEPFFCVLPASASCVPLFILLYFPTLHDSVHLNLNFLRAKHRHCGRIPDTILVQGLQPHLP